MKKLGLAIAGLAIAAVGFGMKDKLTSSIADMRKKRLATTGH